MDTAEDMDPDRHQRHGEMADSAAQLLSTDKDLASERLSAFWEEARAYTLAGRYTDLKALVADLWTAIGDEQESALETEQEIKYVRHALEAVQRCSEFDTELEGHWTEPVEPGGIRHSPEEAFLNQFQISYSATGWLGFIIAEGQPVRSATESLVEQLETLTSQLNRQNALIFLGCRRSEVLGSALHEYRMTGALGPLSSSVLTGLRTALEEAESRYQQINHELTSAHNLIKKLRGRLTALTRRDGDVGVDELKELIDASRKGSGNVNYASLAKKLGVTDKTAKRRVEAAGLMRYARPQETGGFREYPE